MVMTHTHGKGQFVQSSGCDKRTDGRTDTNDRIGLNIRYDTRTNTILTCARKLTKVSLIYRTELNLYLLDAIGSNIMGGSVGVALRRRRTWVQTAVATLSGTSVRQTVHTHRASVHQAAKLAAAPLSVARVTAGLAESNGSL